jgi:hypothetical protein
MPRPVLPVNFLTTAGARHWATHRYIRSELKASVGLRILKIASLIIKGAFVGTECLLAMCGIDRRKHVACSSQVHCDGYPIMYQCITH